MSDELKGEMPEIKAEETQVVPAAEEVKEEPKEEVFDKDRAMATIKNLRGFEKEAKKLREENANLLAKEEDRKRAELSEIDRLKLEKEDALKELSQLRLDKTRREIAEKVKLPFALADRIKGETPEEMEADAKQLFEALPKGVASKTGVTNPGVHGTEASSSREPRIDPFDKGFIESHGGGVILK